MEVNQEEQHVWTGKEGHVWKHRLGRVRASRLRCFDRNFLHFILLQTGKPWLPCPGGSHYRVSYSDNFSEDLWNFESQARTNPAQLPLQQTHVHLRCHFDNHLTKIF